MTILFMILKIIGLILLTILGVLLLLLLTVLFVPFRYTGQGKVEEGHEANANIGLTYLFHLLSVRFIYRDKKVDVFLRILFFKKRLGDQHEQKDENKIPDPPKKKKTGGKQKPSKKRRSGFLVACSAIIKELQKEENKEAFLLCLRQMEYLCRHFGPRKIQGELCFSLGDPCYTGIALGFISMFPILYKNDFHIRPDFESDRIYGQGELRFSGRIRGIHLIVCVIRLMKNKTIRKLFLRGGQSNVRK